MLVWHATTRPNASSVPPRSIPRTSAATTDCPRSFGSGVKSMGSCTIHCHRWPHPHRPATRFSPSSQLSRRNLDISFFFKFLWEQNKKRFSLRIPFKADNITSAYQNVEYVSQSHVNETKSWREALSFALHNAIFLFYSTRNEIKNHRFSGYFQPLCYLLDCKPNRFGP